MATQQEQYGQIANYNISPGTRGNGQSSALEVTQFGTLLVTAGQEGLGSVTGNVASGATDSGNPVKTGGVYNSVAPTLTSGQRGDTQMDANANTKVTQGTLLAGEDLAGSGGVSGQVLGTIQKPVVTTAYSASWSTSFGTATKANAKSTPGQAMAVYVTNANAAVRFFQIHDKATAPAGTNVPVFSVPIPAGTANNPGTVIIDNAFFLQNGLACTLGVGWAVSTTVATFTDSATASEHVVNVGYY